MEITDLKTAICEDSEDGFLSWCEQMMKERAEIETYELQLAEDRIYEPAALIAALEQACDQEVR